MKNKAIFISLLLVSSSVPAQINSKIPPFKVSCNPRRKAFNKILKPEAY